jgi:hypothetical protein
MQRITLLRLAFTLFALSSVLLITAAPSSACWRRRCVRLRHCPSPCHAAPCQASPCTTTGTASGGVVPTQESAAAPSAATTLPCICIRQKLVDYGAYKVYLAHQYESCVSEHCNSPKPCIHQ